MLTWKIVGRKIKEGGDVEIYIKWKYGLRLVVTGQYIDSCDVVVKTDAFDAFAKTVVVKNRYVVDIVVNDKPAAAVYHIQREISKADYIFGRGSAIANEVINKMMMQKYNYI